MSADLITAVAGCVQALVVVVAAVIAVAQVREASRVRIAQSMYALFKDFHDADKVSDRQQVMTATPEEARHPSEKLLAAMQRLVEFHEWTALMVRRGLIPEDIMLDMYSDLFLQSWATCENFVLRVRAKSQVGNYGEHFEYLANLSLMYRRTRYGAVGGGVASSLRSLRDPEPTASGTDADTTEDHSPERT